ncbi:MAG: hypothetical protein KJZ65_10435 [Phycisphaerales bacterium]|nr:hypothetical protein [Phycisphaerales bacterium]
MTIGPTFLAVIFGIVAAVLLAVFGAIVLVRLFKVIGFLISHVARFIVGMFSDTFRFVGALVLMVVLAPLVLGSVVIGRWSAAAHYGRAVKNEVKTASTCVYRVLIGHPFRLIGLSGVTEGLEHRLPQVIAEAPGPDRPSKRRVGMFNGYTIVGSLPGGGSGGRLYIAEPDELKRAAFVRQGLQEVDQVVIKSFSLTDGSSLPQIVRESRALDAAKRLGLVLEHELAEDRFFYVMRYVPGESLSTLTTRMHGLSGGHGLNDTHLRTALGYMADLLRALDTYHRGGLWHKDVKPDNIIVDGKRAHLVDFGLVTPLRSAMTLTTHGTEYFRDPELVRQALRGVKVHQIDGTKFDIYAAGAVLFSVIENSFPAHGGLSQITSRCPEAVRWIVRRAMTDYDKRYATAAEMLADLEAVLGAPKLFEVRPVDLPSVAQHGRAFEGERSAEPQVVGWAHAGSPTPPPLPQTPAAGSERPVPKRLAGRPKLKVTGWWSGQYQVEGEHDLRRPSGREFSLAGLAGPGLFAGVAVAKNNSARAAKHAANLVPSGARAPAAEQLRSARGRAAAKRRAAQQRVSSLHRSMRGRRDPVAINGGTVAGAMVGLLVFAALGAAAVMFASLRAEPRMMVTSPHGSMESWPNGATPPLPSIPTAPAGPEEFRLPGVDFKALSNRSVLVVSDLTPPIDAKVADGLRCLLGGLIDAGGHTLGDAALFLGETDDADSQIELVAELEAARGQRPIEAADVHTTVLTWLKAHEEVDAVLWVTPTVKPLEGVQYTVFAQGSVFSGSASSEVGSIIGDALVRATAPVN